MLENYWPFWIGGPAIAAVAILLVIFAGKYLSVTRGYASLCSIVTSKPYFHRPEMGGPLGVRTFFVVGIVIGGLVAALTTEGFNPTWDLGSFNSIWGDNLLVKAVALVFGGLLWGYGSRVARGCTAGNSISGIARGSLGSVVATVMFLVGGVIVAQLLNLIAGGN